MKVTEDIQNNSTGGVAYDYKKIRSCSKQKKTIC